jgi:hypothetical protein
VQADLLYKANIPNHTYAASTANNNLRFHMENHHEDEYVRVCEKNGWTMQLPRRKVREDTLRQTTLDGIAHTGMCCRSNRVIIIDSICRR